MKWKDTPCSWLRRINIVKMSIVPKTIYILYIIATDLHDFLQRMRKTILKFIWKQKRPWLAKAILRIKR
jgi:hypothetical protein